MILSIHFYRNHLRRIYWKCMYSLYKKVWQTINTIICHVKNDIFLFKLDGCRRFARAVVEYAVNMFHFIDNSGGHLVYDFPRQVS